MGANADGLMVREELLQRVESLIEKTQGMAFVVPEDTGYFSIDDDMVRQVRELMARTVELMRELTDFYDAESVAHGEAGQSAAGGDDLLKDIGALISSELAAREVSGLAFVARGQLMEMQDALSSALEHKLVWAVASHADSSLRHAGKALIAVESAVREYEGLEAIDRRWVDLQDSLATRRLYGQFRRAVLRGGDPRTRDELAASLKSAATRIAILRGLEIYPFLRIDDRLTVRRLQKRIAAWLDGEGDASREAGRRLWQDLISFARLLMKVNDREELREHDRQVVTSVCRLLFEPKRPAQRLSASQLKELERLEGRDDELDHIIWLAGEHSVEDLRAPLERLRSHLQRPFEGPAAQFPLSLGDG